MWQAILPIARQLATEAAKQIGTAGLSQAAGAAGKAATGAAGQTATKGAGGIAADLLAALGGSAGGGGGPQPPPRPPGYTGAMPPPIPPPAGGGGPNAADKAAADQFWNMGKQAFSQMGTTLLHNGVGMAMGQLFQQRGQGGGSGLAGLFGNLGAGPAGQRVGTNVQAAGNKVLDGMGQLLPGGKTTMDAAKFLAAQNPVVKLGKAAYDVAETLASIPSMLEDWGKELLAGQQHLAMFNGQIARTFREAELRKIQRDIKSGASTAGTTDNLSSALSDLQDTIRPLRDIGINVLQFLASGMIRTIDTLIKIWIAVDPITRAAIAYNNLTKSSPDSAFQDMMRAVAGRPRNQGVPKK